MKSSSVDDMGIHVSYTWPCETSTGGLGSTDVVMRQRFRDVTKGW